MDQDVKSPEQANAEALTPVVLRWAASAAVAWVLLTSLAHYLDPVYRWEPVVGALLGGVFGALYATDARRSIGDALWHGGMVGGIGGFVGRGVGVALADRPAMALLTGTLMAIVAGSTAGAVAHRWIVGMGSEGRET